MSGRIKRICRRGAQMLRLMVGVGDYERYLAHCRHCHPEQRPMTRAEHFRYSQAARYPNGDGTIKRCPC